MKIRQIVGNTKWGAILSIFKDKYSTLKKSNIKI